MIAPASAPALTLPLRTPRAIPRAPAAGMNIGPRFTLDGSDELERHLARTCEKIAAGLRGLLPPGKLAAVLLGGGYGRGEGGVLRTAAGDRPYNDLEFYVFLRSNRHLNERRFGRALHVLGEILTPQAGVEVEFKIASLAELARSPVSMFSYDLVLGHRWLVGREELLARCAHHREAERIPLTEATRLLMNRCTGLLLAQERLTRAEFTAGDADFVRRNLAKAALALGDAVLVAYGSYHWSARERSRRLERIGRLETLPWLRAVLRHHAAGVDFKLHPERSTASRGALLAQHAPLTALAGEVWLWLEAKRLGVAFASPRDYGLSALEKWPAANRLRSALLNLKVFGRDAFRSRAFWRHPRGSVLDSLSLLLWEPSTRGTPELLHRVQRELGTRATDLRALVSAYRARWERVN